MSRGGTILLALVLPALAAGCAPPRIQLPTGPAVPLANPERILTDALAHCAGLRTISLEAGLSGRAGGRRVRARLIAGLAAPASIRLEAVAPFGPPGFILAASPSSSVLLLPRDDRVLRDAAPADILAAMAGVAVAPDDLLAYLAGCPGSDPVAGGARRFGESWAAVHLADEAAQAYLRRGRGRGRESSWRLAVIERPGLRVGFEEWQGTQPARVRLQSPRGNAPEAFDLVLRLSQVERNVPLPDAAFTVEVPPEALPITLDDLRQAGPMREAPGADRDS